MVSISVALMEYIRPYGKGAERQIIIEAGIVITKLGEQHAVGQAFRGQVQTPSTIDVLAISNDR